jgi:hypothetical protein
MIHARLHLILLPQSKSGELFNNFVSGAIGGAVGTMINTPCKSSRALDASGRSLCHRSRRCQVTYSDALHRRMVCLVPLCDLAIILTPCRRTFPALLRTAREEGVGALYKGKIV